MAKFFEVLFEGEESSFYLVCGKTLGLVWEGALVPTVMNLKDCERLVKMGCAIAHY